MTATQFKVAEKLVAEAIVTSDVSTLVKVRAFAEKLQKTVDAEMNRRMAVLSSGI